MADKKEKSNMPPKKSLAKVVIDYWTGEPKLGSGKAEEAKESLKEKNKVNKGGLDAAKKALGLPAVEIEEVNQDKKYNSEYGKGGK